MPVPTTRFARSPPAFDSAMLRGRHVTVPRREVSPRMPPNPFSRLPARDSESKDWNVVIETPKGCRNKYKFDEKAGLIALGGVLPAGAVFPFDFGYVPATRGE